MRELDLLQHIYRTTGVSHGRVSIGPGDDMAAVTIGGQVVLLAVDQVVDGVHVRLDRTPIEQVGRKVMVRNLSDVAAMAGKPLCALAGATLRRTMAQAVATQLFDAMRQTGEQYDCPLVGGDIAMHDGPMVLSVTVLAEPAGLGPIRRSGARPGDAVWVTGQLGGAWLEQGGGPHLTAEPRLELARRLAATLGDQLHSMIDLSDGLAGDLLRICEQSGVDAKLEAGTIPVRAHSDLRGALNDGEDYELCFTTAPTAEPSIRELTTPVPITCVGRVVDRAGDEPHLSLNLPDGRIESITHGGWEHHQ
jgi:thiamine-monophosphate kinase